MSKMFVHESFAPTVQPDGVGTYCPPLATAASPQGDGATAPYSSESSGRFLRESTAATAGANPPAPSRDEREPTDDERAGMAWWNSLTPAQRGEWLELVGGNASAADAWALFKKSDRCGTCGGTNLAHVADDRPAEEIVLFRGCRYSVCLDCEPSWFEDEADREAADEAIRLDRVDRAPESVGVKLSNAITVLNVASIPFPAEWFESKAIEDALEWLGVDGTVMLMRESDVIELRRVLTAAKEQAEYEAEVLATARKNVQLAMDEARRLDGLNAARIDGDRA